MPASETQFGVIVGAQPAIEGPRGPRRDDRVRLRVDIEDRHRDLAEVDFAPTQLPGVIDQPVLLIQILEPFLCRLSRMVRSVSHFSMRRKLSSFFSSSTMSTRSRLYFVRLRIGVIIEKIALMNSPGSTPHTSIIESTSSSVRLRVQTLMKP